MLTENTLEYGVQGIVQLTKRKSSKKRYKRETYQFRNKIWNNYMSDQFGKRAKFTA